MLSPFAPVTPPYISYSNAPEGFDDLSYAVLLQERWENLATLRLLHLFRHDTSALGTQIQMAKAGPIH